MFFFSNKLYPFRVHENIIIIGDLSETHWRLTCLFGDLLETDMLDQKPIGDLDMLNWRPTCLIRDPLKTNMPHRRSTCPIGDRHAPSKTDMPQQKPTCPIGDQHAPSETDMPVETHRRPTSLRIPIRIQTHLFKYYNFYIHFAYLNWNNVRTLIRHVSLWLGIYIYQSLIKHVGLQPRMSVFNESPMGHFGLQWVSDEVCRGLRWVYDHAYRSPMGHVGLQGSPMKHVKVSNGSPIRHVGLRRVSNNNNIFVNSSFQNIISTHRGCF